MKYINQRGFLGSIGDDLPSLIPLFFALMIFFAGLAYAFTTINERNAFINTYIDSLYIAKVALGDGSFADLQDFTITSQKLVTTSNYIFGLVYVSKSPVPDSLEFSTIMGDVENNFICLTNDPNTLRLSPTLKIVDGNLLSVAGEQCTENGRFFVASSNVQELLLEYKTNDLSEILLYKKTYSYIYPATLLTSAGNIIVYLVVIVW